MKNILVGTFMAVALFSTPLYPSYAQVASTTEEQVASLREELINLLMQLIAQLQAQLDAQVQKDQAQDEEIEVIKKTSSTRSTSEEAPTVSEEPVDSLAVARSKVGQIQATLSLGEENIYFSVYDYLDTDTVNFDANTTASSTDGGCNRIQGTEYQACGQSAEYPLTPNVFSVSVTVNGVEKTLVLEPGKKGVVTASWPN